ncbi:MAG: ankyrin repeat domain-containing protein [Vicinamibacteraceae bacterium]
MLALLRAFGRYVTRDTPSIACPAVPIGERLPPHGQTGLHWAAWEAHVDTRQALLDAGAAVDIRTTRSAAGATLDQAWIDERQPPTPRGQAGPAVCGVWPPWC